MKKLRLQFSKEVSYWNTTEGAEVRVDGTEDRKRWGVDIQCWDGLVTIEGVQDVQQTVLDYIQKYISLRGGLSKDSLLIMEDGRFSFCLIEDGDGDPIYCEDTFAKKNPNIQLYICDYDVLVEVHEVYTPTVKQLAELLPKAQRGF